MVYFAINSPVRANSGVGFAIPASVVAKVVPALIQDGAYHYAYLGLAGGTITAQVAQKRKLDENVLGVYVSSINLFNNAAPDQQVTLHILRNGKEMTLDVTLGERPSESDQANAQTPGEMITVGNAIKIAKGAVTDAGLMGTIDSASVTQDMHQGQPVSDLRNFFKYYKIVNH